MTAAQAIGNVVIDVPFPNVNPHASSSEVALLADQMLKQIIDQYGNQCVIHVMGELTFCYTFVRKALAQNIRCVSSTTERVAVENADGTKTSQFCFVAFRDYL